MRQPELQTGLPIPQRDSEDETVSTGYANIVTRDFHESAPLTRLSGSAMNLFEQQTTSNNIARRE